MGPITNETAFDFIRMLVNIGGVDLLKEPEMLILNPQGEPRMVSDGDRKKPIQIIVPGMVKDDNNYLFNPLKSVEGNNPAYNWFYTSRGNNIAMVTKQIMVRLITLAAAKETADYESLQLITEISEQCDEQMVQELEKVKLSPADILRIFYDKKIKTAEAQTMLFSDEMETQYKLRKKTWTVLRKIFKTIFELDNDEMTMSKYRYRAIILNIPEIDAKLHVIAKLIAKLEPWSKVIGISFEPEKFEEHLKNLEAYSRMYAWFTARSINGEMVLNNQERSAGLPLRPQTQDNGTTIKINPPMMAPTIPPMTACPPMTAYPNTMQAYPAMTAYGTTAIVPGIVEHDRIALC